MRLGSLALLVAALLARAGSAAAAPPTPSFIVALEGGDVFVDLGSAGGAASGDEVTVFRVIEARQPGTGKLLRDRFPVGTMKLAEVGAVLSLARPEPELARQLAVGDEVAFVAPRKAVVAKRLEPTTAGAACVPAPVAPPPPDELGPVAAAWNRTIGLPPRARAVEWERFVAAHPGSPLKKVVAREAAALHKEADALDAAIAGRAPTLANVEGGAPGKVYEGQPVEIALALPDGAEIAKARLHFRATGEPTYASMPLVPDGDGYLRAKLPDAAVRAPGIEWFASATDATERERPLAGIGTAPEELSVEPDPMALADRANRSRIGLYAENVSFDGLAGDDRYTLLEGAFLYRVLHPALYSVTLGFGVYQGEGGTNAELDAGDSRAVGLNYGAVELEFRLHEYFALIGKGLAGNATTGFTAGAEGKTRIGPEQGTSLVLGASTNAAIGDTGSLQLNWDTVPGFPMSGTVIVTNMPVGADARVRLVYELRRPFGDVFELALRTSYGARDADHGGLGLGLGTVFQW